MLNAFINLIVTSFFTDESDSDSREEPQSYIHRTRTRTRKGTGADLGLLAGAVVSRSHMSFYLRTGGGGATHVSLYLYKG